MQVVQCMRTRLAWTELQLLRDIIFILASEGWQKAIDEKDDLKAVDRVMEKFKIPLQAANVVVEEIHAEFDVLIQHATQYISLSTMNYHAVWWRLFHAPAASEWSNILSLVELLFSLPASNGKVERVFSQMKEIKRNKRSLLSNETLDDLLLISTAEVSMTQFDADPAIKLWWNDKVRRPVRKVKVPGSAEELDESDDSSSSSDSEDNSMHLLSDWDSIVQCNDL